MKIVIGDGSFNRVTAISWCAGGKRTTHAHQEHNTHTQTHTFAHKNTHLLSPLGVVILTEIPCRFKRHKSSCSLIITQRAFSWCHSNYLQKSPCKSHINADNCKHSCNLSMFVRLGPLMDSLCKRPAGSCPLSSRLSDIMILGSQNMKPGPPLIALTPINAKLILLYGSQQLELHKSRNTT